MARTWTTVSSIPTRSEQIRLAFGITLTTWTMKWPAFQTSCACYLQSCWPYEQRTMGTSRRYPWTNCVQVHPFVEQDADGNTVYADNSIDEAQLTAISPSMIMLQEAIISTVRVPSIRYVAMGQSDDAFSDVPSRRTFVSTKRHMQLTADSLSEIWGIGPLRAHATLRATTQRGVYCWADRMY